MAKKLPRYLPRRPWYNTGVVLSASQTEFKHRMICKARESSDEVFGATMLLSGGDRVTAAAAQLQEFERMLAMVDWSEYMRQLEREDCSGAWSSP